MARGCQDYECGTHLATDFGKEDSKSCLQAPPRISMTLGSPKGFGSELGAKNPLALAVAEQGCQLKLRDGFGKRAMRTTERKAQVGVGRILTKIQRKRKRMGHRGSRCNDTLRLPLRSLRYTTGKVHLHEPILVFSAVKMGGPSPGLVPLVVCRRNG